MWAVDNLGRRKLLLIGAAGMCFCEYIVAIVGVATPADNQSAQKCLIAFVCIYIFFFAASWGPCAWVVTSELYPLVCVFLEIFSDFRVSVPRPCQCLLPQTGSGIGVLVMPHLISSSLVQETPDWESKYSSSGDRLVSVVLSSLTSSFLKPRDSPSNKLMNFTMTVSSPGGRPTGYLNLTTGSRSAGRVHSQMLRGVRMADQLVCLWIPLTVN